MRTQLLAAEGSEDLFAKFVGPEGMVSGGGCLSRTCIPVVHELQVSRSGPAVSGVVQAGREVGGTTEGSPLGRVASAMTVEEMKASDATCLWSFRPRINAKGAALDAEPWGDITPMLEDIKERIRCRGRGLVSARSLGTEQVRSTGVERVCGSCCNVGGFCTCGSGASMAYV